MNLRNRNNLKIKCIAVLYAAMLWNWMTMSGS